LISRSWTSASGRLVGGKPFSRGALYLILQNRISRGSGSPEISCIVAVADERDRLTAAIPAKKNPRHRARAARPLSNGDIAVKNVSLGIFDPSLGIFDPARCQRNPDFLGGFPVKTPLGVKE
jgi:hypothetical protein